MGYCTLEEVRQYIGTDETADDALLSALIDRATTRIDAYCQRTFTAREETRYFDAVRDVLDRLLILDDDLLSVTEITNGDGTTVPASAYVLLEANRSPKWAIQLKASSGLSWTYTDDPEQAIAVEGTWGYSTSPPDDIVHAAVRLVAWYYHQAEAPFEVQGMPQLGIVTVPSDMPPDIKALLGPYQRGRIGSV
ncbi:MAG: hypothetical protein KatS3mg051_1423 [Anaerolineae bacterium]|nr:MAG: hypothetical protein KatS3mg051_1423 [Anaerolineae bacterium]